jgi:hypothetical protein
MSGGRSAVNRASGGAVGEASEVKEREEYGYPRSWSRESRSSGTPP